MERGAAGAAALALAACAWTALAEPAARERGELRTGAAQQEQLGAGEVHVYHVAGHAGLYARVNVEQQGADVSVRLVAPDGRVLLDSDAPSGPQGPETASLLPETDGDYRVEVRAADELGSGRYTITLESPRPPDDADRARLLAEGLAAEAIAAWGRQSGEGMAEAISKYEQAMPFWRAAGETYFETLSRDAVARVHVLVGDLAQAARGLEQVLEEWRRQDRPSRQAVTAQSLGAVYLRLGRVEEAVALLEGALALFRELHEPLGEGVTLSNLARAWERLGRRDEALDAYARALALRREAGDAGGSAATLTSLAGLLTTLGEPERAVSLHREALALRRRLGDRRGEAASLRSLAATALRQGDVRQARVAVEQALALARDLGDRQGEGEASVVLARLHARAQAPRRALAALARALELARATGDRGTEVLALEALGSVHGAMGDASQALRDFTGELDLARALRDPEREAGALFGLGRLARDAGRLEQAQSHLEAGLATLERLRVRATGGELRDAFNARVRAGYDVYLDVLARRQRVDPRGGFDRLAFAASERARARGLLDLLAEAGIDLGATLPPDLRTRQADLDTRLAGVQRELIAALSAVPQDGARVRQREQALRALGEEQAAFEEELRRREPAYATLRYPLPPDLGAAQALLDDDTLLLEYALGDESALLFALTRDALLVRRLPPTSELRALVAALQPALEHPGRRVAARYEWAARRLYRLLVEPALPLSAGRRRLLIAADGPLHHVPFEALLTTDVAARDRADFARWPYLLRRFEVGYLPSAGVLASLRATPATAEPPAPPGPELVVFADPSTGPSAARARLADVVRGVFGTAGGWRLTPLPGARREARAIAGTFAPGTALVFEGEQASESAVRDNAAVARARRLHFATHALVSERQPRWSSLVLAADPDPRHDGLLQVGEIFRLRLAAELVVLSACETGLGKDIGGEGLVGLARAFFHAGARSLVLSLWAVSDRSSAELMPAFYRGLREGAAGTAALRQAKLDVIAGGRFAHPGYWAPFVLLGEPGDTRRGAGRTSSR